MIRLAADKDWLHKATKEISKYWRTNESAVNFLSPVASMLVGM